MRVSNVNVLTLAIPIVAGGEALGSQVLGVLGEHKGASARIPRSILYDYRIIISIPT